MERKNYIVKREDNNYDLVDFAINKNKISMKIVGLVDGWLINKTYYLPIQRHIVENKRIKSKIFWQNLERAIFEDKKL